MPITFPAGLIMYFGYGIKNSSLEQLYGEDGEQQIELTIPKDRLPAAQRRAEASP